MLPVLTGTLAVFMLLLLIIWQTVSIRSSSSQNLDAEHSGTANGVATFERPTELDLILWDDQFGQESTTEDQKPQSIAVTIIESPQNGPLPDRPQTPFENELKKGGRPPRLLKGLTPFLSTTDERPKHDSEGLDLELGILRVPPQRLVRADSDSGSFATTFTVSSNNSDAGIRTVVSPFGFNKGWKVATPVGERRAITPVAYVNQSADASSQTFVQTPRLQVRMTVPNQVQAGAVFSIQFEIRNLGTVTLSRSELQVNLPDNLTHRGHHKLDCPIDRLEPGQIRQKRLTVKATDPGTAVTQAEVVANGNSMHTATASVKITKPASRRRIHSTRSFLPCRYWTDRWSVLHHDFDPLPRVSGR